MKWLALPILLLSAAPTLAQNAIPDTPAGRAATLWIQIMNGGGAPGQNGELRIFPTSQTVIVALSNMDPPAASTMAGFYHDRMPLD